MSYQVGDQLLGGQVIVIRVSDANVITVEFTQIKDGLNKPLTVTYDPAGTTMPLEQWLQALIDLLG